MFLTTHKYFRVFRFLLSFTSIVGVYFFPLKTHAVLKAPTVLFEQVMADETRVRIRLNHLKLDFKPSQDEQFRILAPAAKQNKLKISRPTPDKLEINSSVPGHHPFHLQLELPKALHFELLAHHASLQFENSAFKTLKLVTQTGQLMGQLSVQHLDVSGTDLMQTLDLDAQSIRLRNLSRDIALKGRVEKAEVRSHHGSVFADIEGVASLLVNTLSGHQHLSLAMKPHAGISLDSLSGNIDLNIAEQETINCRFHTFQGRLIADTTDVQKTFLDRSQNCSIQAEPRSPIIRVQTQSGDFNIHPVKQASDPEISLNR